MSAMRAIPALIVCAVLAACSVPGPGEAPDGIWDPNEAGNRKTHEFNRKLDKRVLRGSGNGYTRTVPEGVRKSVSNFADTTSLPQTVVNQILQGRPGPATRNTLRFAVNATLGFGGIADVASNMGMPKDESDFGETLHVWGVPEGAYVELPFLGPSTERDTAGRVVDLVTDPLSYVLPVGARRTATAARIVAKVGERGEFSGTVDSLLYDSADSYAQLRLIYLQNRRFELDGTEGAAGDYIDPEEIDTEGF
ncbi:VacJ family lipoprotein [Thalassococcus lentus]|uniref:VacJ family lipoprotein n=2 Tax=Thalassococcus lentus TaxID=1210524 RepID=A0ABT4XSZ9_9RHOB|nr:VacJ family lipoprotein [Thalassococcus lentus]MDA7425084.1 VacJ family lipoprotein [Thalassococcus lentus]